MGEEGSSIADPYIGSLISLTSKSEIRYEGILYTVDTENSNIALQNVRSFGTEGRKKEGPQIPASDKVYEYIIFRGSDIKDLQVKSSPLVQAPVQRPSDPAIISLQAQYSQAHSMPSGYHHTGALSTDQNSSFQYPGMPGTFPKGVPSLYQPAPPMASWASPLPPPGANRTGLAMPMYWAGPGLYRTQPGQAHLQQAQHPLSHSVPLPPLQPQPLLPPPGQAAFQMASPSTSSMPLQPRDDMPKSPMSSIATEPSAQYPLATSSGSMVANAASVSMSVTAGTSSFTSLPESIRAGKTPSSKISRKESELVHPLHLQTRFSSAVGTNATNLSTSDANTRIVTPILRTTSGPQQASVTISSYDNAPGPSMQVHNLEQETAESVSQQMATSFPVQREQASNQPLLPLPTGSTHRRYSHQGNGSVHSHYNRRGRGRGRGVVVSHPQQQFTEDFDFTAMNEKFNKDEVWGELGGKGDLREKILNDEDDNVDYHDEDSISDNASHLNSYSTDLTKKPVYVKDDFFDSLSCDALDREGRPERMKFSEQRKIDVETFGNFSSRSRGGRWMRIHRRGYQRGYYGSHSHSTGGMGSTQGRMHGTI